MLTFHRSFIESIMINETGKLIKNCKLYNIASHDEQVAKFYSGDNYSFIEVNEQKIRIDANIHFFKKSAYSIYNQYTNELIGRFEIPGGGLGRTAMKSTLQLSSGVTYAWTQNTEHRKILQPQTLSSYRFDFLSENHAIVYYGKMTPDVSLNYVNPNQVFEGEIQTTDDQLLIPILLGFYIIEEKFRRIEQDPG